MQKVFDKDWHPCVDAGIIALLQVYLSRECMNFGDRGVAMKNWKRL